MDILDTRQNLNEMVLRHEKEIQELKRLVTPMMEFKQEMPTKICGPNLVGVLNSAGFYQKKEWVGLTGPEVDEAYRSVSDKDWAIGGLANARVFFCAIEAKLKEKNGGDAASDTELRRLGYPL
jgi:hypothetical protein